MDNNSTFLHEHCTKPGCGGQIHRQIERTESNQDDNGGQICHAQIFDRCATCNNIVRQSPRVNLPCLDIDSLFEKWGRGELDRKDFDAAVVQSLNRGGTSWNIEAS